MTIKSSDGGHTLDALPSPGVIEAGLRWFVLGAPARLLRVGGRGDLVKAIMGSTTEGIQEQHQRQGKKGSDTEGEALTSTSRLAALGVLWREMRVAMDR